MKKRNIFAVLALSIITFGIYDIYWLYKTKKVLNEKTGIHTPSIWLLFGPMLVGFILVILAFVLNVATGNGNNGAHAAGTAIIILLDLIAFVAIIPITFYWYFKFSKAVNEYTRGDLNTGVTFLLLWLLHFIGVMIVQDKFNDMIDNHQVVEGTGELAAAGQSPAYPGSPMGVGVHSPQYSAPQPPAQPAVVGQVPGSALAPNPGNIDDVQPPQQPQNPNYPPTPPQA
jgi:hypothetical protein